MAESIQELQVETDARLSWASFHPFRWSIDRVPLVGTGPKERGLTDLLWPYRNLAISQSTSLYSNVKWSNRRIELGFNGCGSNKIMGSLQVLAKTATFGCPHFPPRHQQTGSCRSNKPIGMTVLAYPPDWPFPTHPA